MYRLLAFALLTLASTSEAVNPKPPCPLPAATTQQDRNQAVARRVFYEIFAQGKFQVADEIYARDFVNHGMHKNAGLEEDQAAARWEKTLLPDMTVNVDLIAAEGDLVTVVWTARGTNTGHSGWFPATGVSIEERGITVWRIVDGKIHDELDVLRPVTRGPTSCASTEVVADWASVRHCIPVLAGWQVNTQTVDSSSRACDGFLTLTSCTFPNPRRSVPRATCATLHW